MSDEFELGALLELRRSKREEAELAVARATAAMHAALDEARRLQQRVEDLAAKVDAARGFDIGECLEDLQRNDEYLRALQIERADADRALADQLEMVAQRRRDVDDVRAALAHAEAEFEAVDARRRAWEKERSKIAERRAEAELDEIAVRRWHDGRKK